MAKGCVLVSGATGLVGRRLVPRLAERFASVRLLSRSGGQASATAPVRTDRDVRSWDGVDPGAAAIQGLDAIVHLAGEPIFGGLPTKARLARIRESRIASTHRIVERIAALPANARPRTLVCASAVGIYGDRGEEELSEASGSGAGLLADLCRDWEAAASAAEDLGLRVVRLRIGVVLAREGGALGLMRIPFSLGLGGRLGNGRQYFPWIQIDDLVEAILFALAQPTLQGPVNAVAPAADSNRVLTETLARVLRRPAFLPVPALALKLVMGPLAGELLGSRRVVPKRLLESGFVFGHASLESALESALAKERNPQA